MDITGNQRNAKNIKPVRSSGVYDAKTSLNVVVHPWE